MAEKGVESRNQTGLRDRAVVRHLLWVIMVLLLLGALKLTVAVTLPLTFALFLVSVFWPLQNKLQQKVPHWVAALLSLLVLMLILGMFIGAFWWSSELVAEKWPTYSERFTQYLQTYNEWARDYDLPLFGENQQESHAEKDSDVSVTSLLSAFQLSFTVIGGLVLVLAFFVLGLLETCAFRTKLNLAISEKNHTRLLPALPSISTNFQRYIVVRTGIGLLTGLLTGLFCWAVGLDFAFIWGLINFLLNYIPTLGSIIGVFPPLLFALLQYGDMLHVLMVLAGVGGIQLVMGNYIDPLVQGKYLSLSPLVVLLSVTFWGWLWGVFGALIGVPLTILLVITCRQFERTRWIAIFLAGITAVEHWEELQPDKDKKEISEQ